MVTKLYSATLEGLDCHLIEVEVDFRQGLPFFAIVGLGDKSVQEAKERIASAIRNSGREFLSKRVIVNLAPADMHKSGPSFDLAIAIGHLITTDQLKLSIPNAAFLGELALNGSLRPISGVLPLVSGLKGAGFTKIFLPEGNASEAALVEGIEVYSLKTLRQFLDHAESKEILKPFAISSSSPPPSLPHPYDFADVKGQVQAKRALEIAAAGSHNVLLSGVPGAGKTLLAKCMPGILPELSLAESLDLTKIYSVVNRLSKDQPLVTVRPFRSPHHTSSQVALVGGGAYPRPGEISLSHHGVLFLDEFPEFSSQALEALRQPLEDKVVTVSRAMTSVTFPADFILLAAMNPCKCGYYGDPEHECQCPPSQRERYLRKVSGPILDRIDLTVRINRVKAEKLTLQTQSEASYVVKQRVSDARAKQLCRQQTTNANLSPSLISTHIVLESEAKEILTDAVEKFDMSARAYFRTLKVARTIADLSGSELVKFQHVTEALAYRLLEKE